MKYILVIIVLSLAFKVGYSQHPINDSHYQLVWSDDFNGTQINNNIWKTEDWNDGHAANIYTHSNHSNPQMNGLDRYPSVALFSNIDISNGTMKMHYKTDDIACGMAYNNSWGGVIQNNDIWWCSYQKATGQTYIYSGAAVDLQESYEENYGYYEARIKIPYVHSAWAAFWTFKGVNSLNQGAGEIDIFETTSWDSNPPFDTPNIHRTNIHHAYCASGTNTPGFSPTGVPGGYHCPGIPNNGYDAAINNYSAWHVYGLELTPSKIIWYVDGEMVRIEPNTNIHNSSLTLKLGIGASGNHTVEFPNAFDVVMETDYVRFYKIVQENCDEVVNDCAFYFGGYQNTVKKSITISGNGCSNHQPTNTNLILRATDFVELKGTFGVPLGADLYIDVNKCY